MEKETQLMRDVLAETIRYYKNHPERIGWDEASQKCVYYANGGKRKCAVGRMMRDPQRFWEYPDGVEGIMDRGYNFKSILNPPYNQLGVHFLSHVQGLHDGPLKDGDVFLITDKVMEIKHEFGLSKLVGRP